MTSFSTPLPISGETRLFAIVGDPIAQARSPSVFNALFAARGANAVLVPMQVPASQLRCALGGPEWSPHPPAMVLTRPPKVSVVELLDEIGPVARRVGAVNCMRRRPDGRWGGEMFEGQGFVAGLQREGMPVAGRHVFQAGCGGAGKAVAHALAAAGVASLHLVDAKPELAQALIASRRQHHPQPAVHTGDAPGAGDDLLVTATPCEMAPGDPMPFDLRDAASGAVVA